MAFQTKVFINTAGSLVYSFGIWLLTVFSTRFIGIEAAGELTLSMAISNVLFVLQSFAVYPIQVSDVSYNYSPVDYSITRIATSLPILAVYPLVSYFMGYSGSVSLEIFLFGLFKTCETLCNVMLGEEQRKDRLDLCGVSLVLKGIVTAVSFFIGAYIFKTLIPALLCLCVSNFALLILFDLPLFLNVVRPKGKFTAKNILSILRISGAAMIATLLPVFINALPRTILERYYGADILGYYGNISSPSLVLSALIPTIVSSFYSSYGQMRDDGDKKGIRSLWLKTMAGSSVLTFICMVGLFLFGKPFMAFIYTDDILPYMPYLYLSLLAMLLLALTTCCNAVLVTFRDNKTLSNAIILAFLVCLVISIPLVRTCGMLGAILSLSIPYMVQLIYQLTVITKKLNSNRPNK